MRTNANRTKMRWFNKKVVEENTFALKIIENYCFNGLHCWPLMVFAISISLCQFVVSGIMIYLTSRLYDEGFRSAKFRKGGGLIMIIFGISGGCLGMAWSIVSGHHIARAFMLSTSLMTLFLSIPLAGYRGVVAGSFGGVPAGIAIGTNVSETKYGMLWGGIIGLVCGIVFGGSPIFWKLDSVDRYLNENYYFITNSEASSLLNKNEDEYEIE